MEKKDIVRYSEQNCFSCHMGKRAEFQLQHHHPVPEGKMKCIDCHNPHETEGEAFLSGTALRKSDQTCFKCHKELKGPFVFEHDPMREGCQTCHNPHGSVYDKMLIADQTNLCLRCHWEQGFNVSGDLGGINHNYYIGRGEECIDHHRAPHGSNIWKTFNR
jgi:DmsE family decaheme c-type cytochrome